MMKNKKILSILISSILIFTPCLVYAVEETTPESPPTSEETPEITIKLNKTKLSLLVGENETLKANITGSQEEVTWATDNVNVASVIDGKVTATGPGTTTITATVEGEKATCEVTVTKPVEVSKGTDATLDSVTINNGKLDRKFSSKTYEYTVTLNSGSKSIDLTYEKTDEKAKVSEFKTIDGIKLVVTSEDEKQTNTYLFTVAKETISLNLKSLKINGYALNEEFSSDVLKYTANIPADIDTLTVEAKPQNSSATVEIVGNTGLKVGDNQIKITVKDNAGNSKVYQIIANRSQKQEMNGNPTDIITSELLDSITSDNVTSSDNVDNVATPSAVDKDDIGGNTSSHFVKYLIVSMACLILFAIGGIGIYFYMKTSPKKLRKELTKIKNQDKENPMVVIDGEKTKKDKKLKEDLTDTKEFKKGKLNKSDNDVDFDEE